MSPLTPVLHYRAKASMMSARLTVRGLSSWFRARCRSIRPRRPATAVGLDLGSHALKVVEITRAGGRLAVTGIGTIPTPRGAISGGAVTNPQTLAPVIRALLADAGIRSKRVVISLGGQGAIIREVALPEMPERDLDQAAIFEAERYLPRGATEPKCQYRIVNRIPEEGQVEILVVASASDVVNRQAAAAAVAGLTTAVMEVAPLSAIRSVRDRDGVDRGAIVYATVGAESTDIVVLDGERVRLARNVPVGGDALTGAIAEALSCDWTEAEALKIKHADLRAEEGHSENTMVRRLRHVILPLVTRLSNEVRRSVDFYLARVRGSSVSQIVLTGGTARLRNLSSFLGEATALPVRIGNPLATCELDARFPPDDLADISPTLAVAVGLALRGVRP